MKRRALILSALALLAALFAAGTIAYFTAEGQAHNVITTGGVDIAVQEWADEDKTQPFQDPTGVMPAPPSPKSPRSRTPARQTHGCGYRSPRASSGTKSFTPMTVW